MSNLKYVPIESSLLKEVAFDRENNRLFVKFKKTPATYVYLDFPECEYEALLEGETVGKYFYHHIRLMYAYEKIE